MRQDNFYTSKQQYLKNIKILKRDNVKLQSFGLIGWPFHKNHSLMNFFAKYIL
jgi:hypothetical protein